MIRSILVFLLLSFLYGPVASAQKVITHKPVSAQDSLAVLARGLTVYKKTCLACHMADGRGVPNMNPPLTRTTYVLGKKDSLINIVLKGFNEDVEINGAYYSNSMPPQSFLSDQEVADVLSYVRNNFGNKAGLIQNSDVRRLRPAKAGPSE